jgi:hypothetical protein
VGRVLETEAEAEAEAVVLCGVASPPELELTDLRLFRTLVAIEDLRRGLMPFSEAALPRFHKNKNKNKNKGKGKHGMNEKETKSI